MLGNLQKDLELLQAKNQVQSQNLKNIFLNLSITKNQLQGWNFQIPHSENLLNKVRPEEFNYILQFVDLKTYLRFRLISNKANQTIIKMIPNRIAHIQQILMRRQTKLQELIQGHSENDLLQDLALRKHNAEQGLWSLTVHDIQQIQKIAHPPVVIEKIMTMVCILLDSTFKGENSNWAACLKIIENTNFVIQLKNLSIEKINDKQLKLIQNVHQMTEEQVQKVLSASCLTFYKYIKAIVEIRESNVYQVKSQKDLFEKLIKRDEMALAYLQKMNG